jgi:hypothetical protein
MSDVFLRNFMEAAKKITHAERCMVVNTDLELLEMINVDRAMVESTAFGEFALECLREAIKSDEVVITNNVITDPSDAPTTNTNFANLRVVVALPLVGHGAVYLDQHIRNGIIPRQMIERLMRLATHVRENNLEDSSSAELVQLFQTLN